MCLCLWTIFLLIACVSKISVCEKPSGSLCTLPVGIFIFHENKRREQWQIVWSLTRSYLSKNTPLSLNPRERRWLVIFVRPEARRNLQSDSTWIGDDLMFFSGVNLEVEQRRVNFCRITHISSLTKAHEQHNGVVRMVVIGIIMCFWKTAHYPSPKPAFTLTSRLGQNVGLGEG